MVKHVESMGGIWKLSERAFKKLRRDLKDGLSVDLDDYGKLVLTDPYRLEDLENEIEEEEYLK